MKVEEADVVVVGAGPAGLEAAVAASEVTDVILLDDNPHAGGQIWRRDDTPHGKRAAKSRRDAATVADLAESFARAGGRRLTGARVFDAPASGLLHVERTSESGARFEPEFLAVRYRKLILATGARELFLPFPGWTLPGVYGVGALQAMVKGGLDVRGRRIGFAGTGPLLYAVARDLRQRGAEVVVIAEQARPGPVIGFGLGLWRDPKKLFEGFLAYGQPQGVELLHETVVGAVEGERRARRLITTTKQHRRGFDVDLVAASWGLVPETRLARLLGCEAGQTRILVDEHQQTSVPGVYAAGEVTGIGGSDKAVIEGTIAGLAATQREDEARALFRRRRRTLDFAARLGRAFALEPALFAMARDNTLVCRCEDVPRSALRRQPDFRAAKLASRCGMGACQGRVCGPAAACLEGWPLDAAEAPRPPLFPVSFGTLAEAAQSMNNESETST